MQFHAGVIDCTTPLVRHNVRAWPQHTPWSKAYRVVDVRTSRGAGNARNLSQLRNLRTTVCDATGVLIQVSEVQGAGCGVRGTGCRVQGAGYRLPGGMRCGAVSALWPILDRSLGPAHCPSSCLYTRRRPGAEERASMQACKRACKRACVGACEHTYVHVCVQPCSCTCLRV